MAEIQLPPLSENEILAIAETASRRISDHVRPMYASWSDVRADAAVSVLEWVKRIDEKPESVSRSSWLVMKVWGSLKDKYISDKRHQYDSLQPRTIDTSNPSPVLTDVKSYRQEEQDDREQTETRIDVTEALDRLPVSLRSLARMHFIDGMTQQQIADDMGVSQSYVSIRLDRIQAILRTYLEAYAEP